MAKKEVKKKPELSAKQKLFQEALGKLQKNFGDRIDTLANKKEELKIEVIPTRSSAYNQALHGGLARGKVSEVFGPEDSGKTSILLDTIGYNMQINPEFTAGWYETEGHFDFEYAVNTFGIDPNRFIIWHMGDEGAEDGLDMLESILRSGAMDCLVVNTVAGLTPKDELDAKMAKHHMALQARMMSKLMRKVIAIANTTKTHISFINQIRSDIGSAGPNGAPNVTTGGVALRFYASQRIFQKNGFMNELDNKKGYDSSFFKRIDVQVRKNRISTGKAPFQKCSYYVEYGVGIDTLGEIPQLVEDLGILKKSGAWFYDLDASGSIIVRNGTELRWQGKGKFREYLKVNPDYVEELRNRIASIGIEAIDNVEAMTEEEMAEAEAEEIEAIKQLEEFGVELKE